MIPDKPWFSPSRLKVFAECPKKYEFQCVRKLPTRPTPHFDLGSNVHAALRDWLRLPPSARTWDGLLELYRRAWRANRPAFLTRSRAELRDWGLRGIAMLERFVRESPPDLEPIATEKSVRVDFGDVVVGGRVDRVDALPDGGLAIVDYKTGRFPANQARARDEDLAAAIYARGVSEAFAGAPVSHVEYLYLESWDRLTFEVEETWQSAREAVVAEGARAAFEAQSRAEFPARPSPLCRWCDFRQRCPEGQAFLDGGRGRG